MVIITMRYANEHLGEKPEGEGRKILKGLLRK
jgi:hypothetical protein